MKRCIIYAAALSLLGFCSCQSDSIGVDPLTDREETGTTYEMTNEEITELLNSYFRSVQSGIPATRGNAPAITGLNKIRYDNPVVTRSGDMTDNGFSICNVDIKDGEKDGFAIVVADKRFPVVLAYSPNGKYSELKEKGSTNLVAYVENIPDNVKSVLVQPRYLQPGYTDPLHKWKNFPYPNNLDDIYSTSTIDGAWMDVALLKQSVLWGQGDPYNKFMPLNDTTKEPMPVGCVNIALSQVMGYYKHPVKYNWELMTSLVNIENNPFTPVGMEDTICTFIKKLAKISNTKYNYATNISTNTIKDCCNALDTFQYAHSEEIVFNTDSIFSSLKNKKYVIAFGKTETGTGHAIAVSGYWKFTVTQSMKDEGKNDGTNIGVNWGTAGGWGDGWYLVEYGEMGLDILGLRKYDPVTGGYSSKDFQHDLRIVTNITPKK